MIPVQLALTAIVSSLLLGLLALGFTLQYITMDVPNLAYTTLAFFSTYIILTMVFAGFSPYIGLPLAFILCGFVSFLLYKFMAFLRDRGTSLVGLMISTLVFDLIIYGLMNIYADYISYSFKAYARSFTLTEFDFTYNGLPGVLYVSLLSSLLLIGMFQLLLVKTKFGTAMRGVTENYSLASVHGINVEFVLGFSWFFVGGIAGVAGSLYPLWFYMDPWVGARMFITLFAACVVGGLRSIYGALAGGIIVGASEVFVTYAFASLLGSWIWTYRAIVPIAIACIVLLVIPEGVTGFIGTFRER